MTAYRKDFDETKYLSFLIKGDELLEKYNEILEKVKDNLKKEFESEPVYNEKYLKVKIISYNGKPAQVSTERKYQKEIFNIFADQYFRPILFLEEVNIIIHKCL